MKKYEQIFIFFVFIGVYNILGSSDSESWNKFFWTGLNIYLSVLVIQLSTTGKTSSIDIIASVGLCVYLFLDTLFYYIVPSGEMFDCIDMFLPKLVLSMICGIIFIIIKKISNG